MNKLATLLATILLFGSGVEAQQSAATVRMPSITVSAETTLSVEPDQAQIDIGVVNQAPTAPEASRENADRVARVLAEIKKRLGTDDEVQTSGYALTPNYRYPRDGKPEIAGYTASNTLRVKTTNLNLVGPLIDSAMQVGANHIHRLVFTLKDELSTQLEALRLASAKAKTKAEAIAASLGLKILRITAVNESERTVQPIFREALATRADAPPAPTPVEPGRIEVRSAVSLTVEVSEK